MTYPETVELFGLLAAAYPKEPITEAQIALYAVLLGAYSVEAVREAVLRHIQQSPWFPRLNEVLDQTTPGDQADPDQAWAEVQQKIRSVGYYRHPTWSQPAIAQVVEALGWQNLCLSTNPEADRAHFLRFYGTARQREQHRRHWAQLPAPLRQALEHLGTPDPSSVSDPREVS